MVRDYRREANLLARIVRAFWPATVLFAAAFAFPLVTSHAGGSVIAETVRSGGSHAPMVARPIDPGLDLVTVKVALRGAASETPSPSAIGGNGWQLEIGGE